MSLPDEVDELSLGRQNLLAARVSRNIFRQSFEEIWNSEGYRKFRQDSIDRKLGYAVCRNCTPNRLRDFVRLAGVLPGFAKGGGEASGMERPFYAGCGARACTGIV